MSTSQIPRFTLIAAAALVLLSSDNAHAGEYPFTTEHDVFGENVQNGARPQFKDVDGDGDADIVSLGYVALEWFENLDGTGEDFLVHSVDPTLYDPDSVETVDIDGDGDLDFVTTGPDVRWYENLGEGVAFEAHMIADEGSGPIVVGDGDGDGALDVFVAASGELLWFRNPGDPATDWPSVMVISEEDFGDGFAGGDFDGDGQLELIGADNYNDHFYRLDYQDGPWTISELDTNTGPTELSVIDWDGDGDLDALAGMGRRLGVLINVGSTFGFELIEDNGNLFAYYRPRPADIDMDGDLDVVTYADAQDGSVRWYENVDGELGEMQVLLDGVGLGSGMDVADMDCDGDIDIVVHGDRAGTWRYVVLENETVDNADADCDSPGGSDSGDDSSGTDTTDGDTGGNDTSGSTADGGGSDAGSDTDGGTANAGDTGAGDGSGGEDTAPQNGEDTVGGCSVGHRSSVPLSLMALLGLLGWLRRRPTA